MYSLPVAVADHDALGGSRNRIGVADLSVQYMGHDGVYNNNLAVGWVSAATTFRLNPWRSIRA